jgi:hypothetical protein
MGPTRAAAGEGAEGRGSTWANGTGICGLSAAGPLSTLESPYVPAWRQFPFASSAQPAPGERVVALDELVRWRRHLQ